MVLKHSKAINVSSSYTAGLMSVIEEVTPDLESSGTFHFPTLILESGCEGHDLMQYDDEQHI